MPHVAKILAPPVGRASCLVFAALHVIAAHRPVPKLEPPVEPPRAPSARPSPGPGLSKPMTENISIGSALPGIVLEVYVPVEKVGQRVKKGDPLFQVDDRQLKAQLKLSAGVAGCGRRPSWPSWKPCRDKKRCRPARPRSASPRPIWRMQQDLAQRAKRLIASHAMADGGHPATQADAGGLPDAAGPSEGREPSCSRPAPGSRTSEIARAEVSQARAQVEQTKTDIERALVRAPVDGEVLQVNVRPGEYVGTPSVAGPGGAGQHPPAARPRGHRRARHPAVSRPGAPARASLRGNPDIQISAEVRARRAVCDSQEIADRRQHRARRYPRAPGDLCPGAPADKPVYVGQQLDVFIDAAMK